MKRMNETAVFVLLGSVAAACLSTPAAASDLELWVLDQNARLDGVTGAYLGPFMQGSSITGFGMGIGPDGNLYVSGADRVERYDPETYQYIDTFVASGSGGLDEATDLTFGPDGNLYVASAYTSTVLRYDGQTGAFLNVFASEGVGYPEDMRFGPDGNLYVASLDNDGIVRYDGASGDLIDVFATDENLSLLTGLAFGPDGDLYVLSAVTPSDALHGNVTRFDGATGEALGFLVPPEPSGLILPRSMEFGPDGNLYIGASYGKFRRYNSETGAFIDVFADLPGAGAPRDLMFIPEPGSLALLLVGAGAVLRRRR